MVALCETPIQAEVIRLVLLNGCGVPVTGASSMQVVTDGFISIAPEPQYEDGDEFVTKKASGRLCVNKKTAPQYTRSQLDINWCVLDPDALVMVSGGRLLTASAITGTGVAFGRDMIKTNFSLETWQPVAGRGACDPITGLQRYVYWAWPNVTNTKINGWSIENGPVEFSTTHETDFISTLWGNGPGSDGPWIEEDVQENDDFLFNITTTPPPTIPDVCGAFLLT